MNLDQILAVANGTKPSSCPCPCRTYGHAPCDRPAETMYHPPLHLVAYRPAEPLCRQCAELRAALHSPDGTQITISFPAREGTVFAEGTFDALVGKPIKIFATVTESISGLVLAADVAAGGRTVEVTIGTAHLIAAVLPAESVPEGFYVPRHEHPDPRGDDQAVGGAVRPA